MGKSSQRLLCLIQEITGKPLKKLSFKTIRADGGFKAKISLEKFVEGAGFFWSESYEKKKRAEDACSKLALEGLCKKLGKTSCGQHLKNGMAQKAAGVTLPNSTNENQKRSIYKEAKALGLPSRRERKKMIETYKRERRKAAEHAKRSSMPSQSSNELKPRPTMSAAAAAVSAAWKAVKDKNFEGAPGNLIAEAEDDGSDDSDDCDEMPVTGDSADESGSDDEIDAAEECVAIEEESESFGKDDEDGTAHSSLCRDEKRPRIGDVAQETPDDFGTLVQRVKMKQQRFKWARDTWLVLCDVQGGGIWDPAQHSADHLLKFLSYKGTGDSEDGSEDVWSWKLPVLAGSTCNDVIFKIEQSLKQSATIDAHWHAFCDRYGGSVYDVFRHDEIFLSKFQDSLKGNLLFESRTTSDWMSMQDCLFGHLKPPPKNWIRIWSRSNRKAYFFNIQTQESNFEMPVKLENY
eukprot:gnl/MRDRNA2_/MRDRNA2_36231_c0_seq1.p1 gnl/MRDRNA2_/MRDRNA2_36231_c0~~gnl/MRDRNA2_/MRDRNA2_36231_c0_seq1.p1  ORF type:complete len:462 (-),score=97.75 gnl/MRDRNA2_/MRDRNA2_36231_c0_seq1:7-1392(-)